MQLPSEVKATAVTEKKGNPYPYFEEYRQAVGRSGSKRSVHCASQSHIRVRVSAS